MGLRLGSRAPFHLLLHVWNGFADQWADTGKSLTAPVAEPGDFSLKQLGSIVHFVLLGVRTKIIELMLGAGRIDHKDGHCKSRQICAILAGYGIIQVMAIDYRTFAEFWPFYLREHSRPRTRALHYAGTSLVVAITVFTLVTGQWWWLLAVPVAGYGFAWIAHFRFEKNRPATFTYPLWSLAADFKMWWLWLTGRLGTELDKAGIRNR